MTAVIILVGPLTRLASRLASPFTARSHFTPSSCCHFLFTASSRDPTCSFSLQQPAFAGFASTLRRFVLRKMANGILLLQSTASTAAGLALMLWPAASDFIFVKGSSQVRALCFVLGAVLVFIGALLCTAKGGAALRGVGMGSLVVAGATGFLLAAPAFNLDHHVQGSKNFRPLFLQAVTGYFALAGISAYAAAAAGGKKAAVEVEQKRK